MDNGRSREIRVQEAGEQGTGSGRFWTPSPHSRGLRGGDGGVGNSFSCLTLQSQGLGSARDLLRYLAIRNILNLDHSTIVWI